jgi:hypothetical protein
MGVAEYITCGTMFKNSDSQQIMPKNKRSHIAKDSRRSQDIERLMLNNEYLKILRDPKFNDINVNFLDF